jgi:AcrR family transcriptional regulator
MQPKKVRRPIGVRSQRKPKGFGQERRDEIIAAAKELFMAEGFTKVTTRALAEKAGISQTGIYLYFKTKEDILSAIGDETHDAITEEFDRVAAAPGTPRQVLQRLIHAYVDYGLNHPADYHLTFTVSPDALAPIAKDFSRPIEQQEAGARSFMRFRDHLARLAPAGVLGDFDPNFVTQVMWFVGHGTVSLLTTRTHFPWADRNTLVAVLEDIIINGLASTKPPKPARRKRDRSNALPSPEPARGCSSRSARSAGEEARRITKAVRGVKN